MAEQPPARPETSNEASSPEQKIDPDKFRIEEICAKAKYDLAIAKLCKLLDSMQAHREDLANLQGQLANIEHESTVAGTISFDEKSRNENRIANGFLQCLRDIKLEIGKNLKIIDLPVLSRKITDQAEVLKIVTEELLAGRYERLEIIPGGNSGLFFKATSKHTGQPVVLKVLKIMNITDLPKAQIELALKLKHRNIIRIVDHNFEQLPAFVILEYINGIKLDDAIHLFRGFPLEVALRIGRDLTSALDYIRKRGIRHANIRPSKIYIDDEGLPMISSLDIIKHEKDELMSLNRFKEECRYLSPEALAENLDPNDLNAVERSDLFSLGLILLEMLTAEPLFRGDSVMAIIDDRREFFAHPNTRLNALLKMRSLKVPLVKILKDMLAEDPKVRPASLNEALEALTKIKDSAPPDCSAKASYHNVKERHHNLIESFYKNFINALPMEVRDKVKESFVNPDRQQMMLKKAIDVVLDIELPDKEAAFLGILARPVHAAYSTAEYYEIFLSTLRDTIIDLHDGKETDKIQIGEAWNNKIHRCLMLTAQYLKNQEQMGPTKFLSADITVG